MVVTLVLCALAGLFGGLLISSLVRTSDRAMSIVPIVLIPQVVFSGAVFDLSGWAKALSYLTVSHWCLAALGSTVRLNEMATRVAVNGQAVTLARPGTPLPDVVANWPKEMYSSPDGVHLLGYWGALLLSCVLCLLGTYAALRRGDVGISRRAADGPSRRTWLLLTVPPVLLCSLAMLIAGLRASAEPLRPEQGTPVTVAHRLPPRAALAPASGGTVAASLFVEPSAGRGPVLAAIGAARRSLDVAMYLFTDRTVQQALIEARRRGVRVRVLLEPRPVGGEDAATGNREAFAALGRGGVAVQWATPPGRLLHEKVLVADGAHALLMTLNFTRAAFTTNRDFGVVDDAPQDVAETEALFAADWRSAAFAPSDPDLVVSPANSRARIPALIGKARRSVELWTEYLRDDGVQRALAAAARRGVRVRVILGATAANRQVRDALAGTGVQVALVARPVMHAKAMVIDGRMALVGSQNLTAAALDRNREEGVLLANPAALARLEATFRLDWPVAAG
jgi:phosphatidylserine/phosphatidylglycerophosphate/cardiolipin synthase-like enzyme